MCRLRNLRMQMGYTQTEIEEITGINQSYYSKLEKGTRNLTLKQCEILSSLYQTSIDYLVGLTDDPTPYPRKK